MFSLERVLLLGSRIHIRDVRTMYDDAFTEGCSKYLLVRNFCYIVIKKDLIIYLNGGMLEMEKYTDKMGVFEDLNFKLVVIEALLDKDPAFQNQLEGLIEKYTENYEWYTGAGPINEMLQFFAELHIEQKDLDKVTELCFDGGNEIYSYILPDWDGEDSLFDIQSVGGFERLKNLKSVEYISMLDEEVLEPMKEHGITIK